VAWYQAGRGKRVGCERQLEKARRRLEPYAPSHQSLDVTGLLHSVDEARGHFPDLPRPLVADALSGGPELERALAFMRRVDVESATHAEPFRFGTLLSDPERPAIYDRNVALLEDAAGDARAADVAAETERAQAGLAHRRAVVHDETAATRLAPGFRELGWRIGRFLVMRLAGEPPEARHEVVEVSHAELEPSLLRWIREEDEPGSEEVERQLLSMGAPLREIVDVRVLAHRQADVPVSWCELYSDGNTGQIEDVGTLREHRGRGYASAVVSTAALESRAAGHDLTFLTVDEVDGPRALYERLGFVGLGREHVFFRPPR
jgi:GNAT superfamily N-acetyltransferase